MDVGEAQRRGIAVLLFIGVVIDGFSALVVQGPPLQMPRIPWIDQQREMDVIEIIGETEKSGIYFLPSSANRDDLLKDIGMDGVVSPGRLREALATADSALSIQVRDGKAGIAEMAAAKRLAIGLPINLNKASAEDLAGLPGIGIKRASQIIEWRQRKGGFKAITDLRELPGISQRSVETLGRYLILGERR